MNCNPLITLNFASHPHTHSGLETWWVDEGHLYFPTNFLLFSFLYDLHWHVYFPMHSPRNKVWKNAITTSVFGSIMVKYVLSLTYLYINCYNLSLRTIYTSAFSWQPIIMQETKSHGTFDTCWYLHSSSCTTALWNHSKNAEPISWLASQSGSAILSQWSLLSYNFGHFSKHHYVQQ